MHVSLLSCLLAASVWGQCTSCTVPCSAEDGLTQTSLVDARGQRTELRFPFSVVHFVDGGDDVIKDGEFGEGQATATLNLTLPDEVETSPAIDLSLEDEFDQIIGSHFYMRHRGSGQIGDGYPYTAIGAFYPLARENGIVFGTAQMVLDNDGNAGGGFTLGRRWYDDVSDRVFGISTAYDVHKTRFQSTAQQIVASLECRGDVWDVFANAYWPVSNPTRGAGLAMPGGVRFQGNDLVVDLMDMRETLMSGADVQIARRLGDLNVWGYGGWYHFQGGGHRTNGFAGGVNGYLTDRLAMTVSVTDDPLFHTNVGFNVTYFFGGRSGGAVAPPNVFSRMAEPVHRRDVAVVNETMFVQNSVPLSSGGITVSVTHVQSGAPGANLGTFEDPFTTLPATQPTDVVYVYAEGVFNNQSYQLGPNQRLLGEGDGANHIVDTDLGPVVLPPGSGGAIRPVILNSTVNAIDVINVANAEISNLQLTNPTAAGIFVENSTVNVNRVVTSGGMFSLLAESNLGDSSAVLALDNRFLGATAAGIFGLADNNGSVLNLTLDGNEIDTQGNDIFDSLFVQLLDPNALVRLSAEANFGSGGGPPDDFFQLMNNTGNPIGFQIRAVDALDLSNLNDGVLVDENPVADAFLYDPVLLVPFP